MRRSICLCEPQVSLAGQVSTWRFRYQTATPLPKGAKLKFDMMSNGRRIDWEIPSVDIEAPRNTIYGELEDGTLVNAVEVEVPDSFVPHYEFTLSAALKAGAIFTIVVGAPPAKIKVKGGESTYGTRAQTTIQRRRQCRIMVDAKGKGSYEPPEYFSLDIKGNICKAIRILTPSLVVRNKRFDVTVRFEDEHGNLTSNAPEGTLVDLTYENLRESLNWKLFVPETGFVTLPNLYLNEPGVYKIKLQNLRTGEVFVSSPIKCLAESSYQLYWGLLHGESERVDSTESIEACLRHFRDERNLNFYATSCFDKIEETSNEIWKLITQNVTTFNEEDRFTVFLGFQWQGESFAEGLRHFVYLKDAKPILRCKDLKYNGLKKIYRSSNAKEMLAIPLFTMGKGLGYDFKDFNPEFERVVEIYNAWGSSECSAKEGNPRPINSPGRKGVKEFQEGSIQKALADNCRFGFVAGGLDDRGVFADFFEGDQDQYSPGCTAILSPKHTREALFDALIRRSCYATTGARIIIGLFLAGKPMGSELNTKLKPGLSVNRHISGYVAGTEALATVEIIRNGSVIKSFETSGNDLDFTYDDMDDLNQVVLPGKEEKPPFVYYYLRVVQKDEQMAWSSPIWVDHLGMPSNNGQKKGSKKTSSSEPGK